MARVRETTPLVHNITNYVTVNDCANILLACGGSPIMADDIEEVEDITSICQALVINIGTLNQRTIASMIKAGKKANQLGHPVILDPVGAGASHLRTGSVFKLLQEVRFDVVRGNVSEIMTVNSGAGSTKGVDASADDRALHQNTGRAIDLGRQLSRKVGAITVTTGAVDIVADPANAFVIRNGHPFLGKVSGTGCMLSAMIGAFCGANLDQRLEATAAAVCMMGIAGELAYEKTEKYQGGTAAFKIHLIDAMSQIDENILKARTRIESR